MEGMRAQCGRPPSLPALYRGRRAGGGQGGAPPGCEHGFCGPLDSVNDVAALLMS